MVRLVMVDPHGGMKPRVAQLREARGIPSREALARKAGVSVKTVARLEAGERTRADILAKVADALEVTVWDLRGMPEPAQAQSQLDHIERMLEFVVRALGADPDVLAGGDTTPTVDPALGEWLEQMPGAVLDAALKTAEMINPENEGDNAGSSPPARASARRAARAPRERRT